MIDAPVLSSRFDPCCIVIVLYCGSYAAQSDATRHGVLKAAVALLTEINIGNE